MSQLRTRCLCINPRRTMLHQPENLCHGFFRDSERFNQESYLTQISWHEIHISLMINHKFGHITMGFLDPAFGKISCIAKVLVSCTTSATPGMMTGATHCWHDQVTRFQATDSRTDLLDLSERFMPDYQIVMSLRWRAVFEGADLSVRTTDTDVEHAKHYLIRLGEPGRFMFEDLECLSSWKNRDCLHAVSFHKYKRA